MSNIKRPEGGVWETAEAKEQLAAVIRAAEQTPQVITRHSKPVVVVLGYDQYMANEGRLGAQSLFEMFAEVRRLSAEDDFELNVPPRKNRKTTRLGLMVCTL